MDIETHMMTTLERVRLFRLRTMAVLYVLVAVATFGYAAEAKDAAIAASSCYAMTTTENSVGDKVTRVDKDAPRVQCERMPGSVSGLFAAIAWPLYWSWAAWDRG